MKRIEGSVYQLHVMPPKTAANSSKSASATKHPSGSLPSSGAASAFPPGPPAAPSPLSRSAPPPSPSSSAQGQGRRRSPRRDQRKGATSEAADLAMGIPNSNEVAYTKELDPCIAAVAAIYGDPSGKYAELLANGFPGYASAAYFLWNQPLAGGMDESAAVLASLGITGTEGVAAATGTTQGTPQTRRRRPWDKYSGAVRVHAGSWVLPTAVIAGLLCTFCS
ncbi:hypothetical protein LshimejAT787_0400430 [Lyophyllum shimeji]|uniref:Uncharacterized protein n=1 Tax=Lyophyllum shimeji TaxID=47721 RepID=A0A9P3PKH8_LYOSH|nr:hypothetical protein LshimejAT787_0400430 [Lyophyllum shimeji]